MHLSYKNIIRKFRVFIGVITTRKVITPLMQFLHYCYYGIKAVNTINGVITTLVSTSEIDLLNSIFKYRKSLFTIPWGKNRVTKNLPSKFLKLNLMIFEIANFL